MNALTRLKTVFAQLLTGGDSDTAEATPKVLKSSYASLNELNEVMAEQRRLGQLKREQDASESRLLEEIRALDAKRIELLTANLVNGEGAKNEETEALAEQIAEKKRQHADASLVAATISKKIDAMNGRRDELKRSYLGELGVFLDGTFKGLATEYDEKARDLADIVLQIGALQQVMMLYKAGNSNGFDRRVYLPKIVAGEGSRRGGILDGDSTEFREGAARHQALIQEQLRSAGFVHRFD